MSDDITIVTVLRHVQAMKKEQRKQITDLSVRMDRLTQHVGNLAQQMHQGFEEATQHREAIQKDLEAAMRVQIKHARKLARMGA